MQASLIQSCHTCRSLAGEARISPGLPVCDGTAWVVEHAYPTAQPGWLVIVLKRHAAALHELTAGEAAELGVLQYRAVRVLRRHFGCVKEYVACFAEKPGFQHVHVHVVQIAADLAPAYRATGIFGLLNPSAEAVVPAANIRVLCQSLREEFATGEDGP